MTNTPGVRTALSFSLVLLALAGCGERSGDGAVTASTTQAPTPSPSSGARRWIAVIEVASRPGELDRLTDRLIEPLGTALVVSPTDCYDGLPPEAGNGYLIGAVGDTRAQAEGRVDDADEEVLFSARVTSVCTD